MKITLVGMGSGAPGSLTAAGLETLRGAACWKICPRAAR